MTTLHIHNSMIIINLPEAPDDYDNCEKQKMVISITYLAGFNINYTSRTITLFLNLDAMKTYLIDFNRGDMLDHIIEANFAAAVAQLG